MAVCTYGHENPDAARFCTTCGLPVRSVGPAPSGSPVPPGADGSPVPPAPLPGWGAPPPSDHWGAPVATPAGWVPAPTHAPGAPPMPAPRGRRRGLLVTGIIVLLVLALCAVGVVVVLSSSGDDDKAATKSKLPPLGTEVHKDLVVVSTANATSPGNEGIGTLYLLREGQPIGHAQSFGHGKVVPIGRLPHREAPTPISTADAGPGGLYPIAGGAVVAWVDKGKVTVAAVPLGRKAARTLYTGSEKTGVGLGEKDVDGNQKVLIEDEGTCFESTGGAAYPVAYGPESCQFQRTGEIITGEAVGTADDEQRFTVLDDQGIPITELEPTGTSAEIVGNAVAVRRDSTSGQILAMGDLDTGRALSHYPTREYPDAGRTWDDSKLLLPWADDDPMRAKSVGIDLVDAEGKIETVAQGERAAARIEQGGSVVSASGDWTKTTVKVGKRELISGPGADFEVVPGDAGTSSVVAWDRTGRVLFDAPGSDDPEVGKVKGLTELSQFSTVRDDDAVYALTSDHRLVRIDADGVDVYEGAWSDIEVADATPRGALVVATEEAEGGGHGSDQALLLVQGAEARTLDEGQISHPRFAGDEVIYQRGAAGSSSEEPEIRKVSARSGAAKPKTIQRGAAIALPATVRPVWRAGDGSPRWLSVSGCGDLPAVAPVGSYNGPADRPTTTCLAAGGMGATITLTFSTNAPTRIVVVSGGRTVATLDGPFDQKQVTFHTVGGPVSVRTTDAGDGDLGWLMDMQYHPDS